MALGLLCQFYFWPFRALDSLICSLEISFEKRECPRLPLECPLLSATAIGGNWFVWAYLLSLLTVTEKRLAARMFWTTILVNLFDVYSYRNKPPSKRADLFPPSTERQSLLLVLLWVSVLLARFALPYWIAMTSGVTRPSRQGFSGMLWFL